MSAQRTLLWTSVVLMLLGGSLALPHLLLRSAVGDPAPGLEVPVTGRAGPLPSRDMRLEHQFPPAQTLEEAPRYFDVRGNEIARPVARYRVDERGTLYEVHSPHTEVPRLAPPQL